MILMLGVLLYIRFGGLVKNSQPPPAPIDSSVKTTSSNERLTALEIAVATLKNQFQAPAPAKSESGTTSTPAGTDVDLRLKALETAVNDIRQRLGQSQSASTPVPAQTSTKKTPVYIPLGTGGTTTDQGGEVLSLFEASINPDDYSGYSGMQLEVNLRMTQVAGTAYARLYNFTDSQSIAASEVSTTSDKSTWVTSSNFKLTGGQKTYRLWAKSSQGFKTEIQSARLKVNF